MQRLKLENIINHLSERKSIKITNDNDIKFLKINPYDNTINQIKYYFIIDFNQNKYTTSYLETWIKLYDKTKKKDSHIFSSIIKIENTVKSTIIYKFAEGIIDLDSSYMKKYINNYKNKIEESYPIEYYLNKIGQQEISMENFIYHYPHKFVHLLSFKDLLGLTLELEQNKINILNEVDKLLDNKFINSFKKNETMIKHKFKKDKKFKLLKYLKSSDNLSDDNILQIIKIIGRRKKISNEVKIILDETINCFNDDKKHFNKRIFDQKYEDFLIKNIITNKVNDEIFGAKEKDWMKKIINEDLQRGSEYNAILNKAKIIIFRNYYYKNKAEIINKIEFDNKFNEPLIDMYKSIKKDELIDDEKFYTYLLLNEMRQLRNDIAHGKTFLQTYKRREETQFKKILLDYFEEIIEKKDKEVCLKMIKSYNNKYYS